MNYLYNGIELPALPETVCPFACIYNYTHDSYCTAANLAFLPEIKHYHGTFGNGEPYAAIDKTNAVLFWFDDYSGSTNWQETENDAASIIPYRDVVWANFDVVDEAGNLYLAASEPVPVGGEPIDKASFMQDYIVGRRLAGMRK